MTTQQKESLPFLSSQQRLDAYQIIVNGCSHIWSKNKIQEEKAKQALNVLAPLTSSDPYFLAHLTSHVINKSKSKDLKVFLSYISSLSSADGTPFSKGSKYSKPNLRYISSAAIHTLDPKLVERVAQLSSYKYGVQNLFNEATHCPSSLRTALKKYLRYRESRPEILTGIQKAGMGQIMKRLYRRLHLSPSDDTAKILRWQQKDHKIELGKRLFTFEGLDDLKIAETIRNEKLPYIGVLGELSRVNKKVSPVIAVALLEQATGNQAVILRATFEDAGILKDPEVLKLYEEKIKGATTALDRADTLSKNASEAVKQVMKQAKSEVRKSEMAGVGKVFVALDFSGSMSEIRDYAAERGAILAELVNNPSDNFAWGWFSGYGHSLPLPQEFTKDAFSSVLFGQGDGGSTNTMALYGEMRKFGADIDVYLSDQGNTDGNPTEKIKRFHLDNPDALKPRCAVIIHFNPSMWGSGHDIKNAYETNGIPAIEIKPETLTESALVVEAVRNAMLGPVAIVDEIMDTELLKLPNYYYAI